MPKTSAHADKKPEAIRLRNEERMGAAEIGRRLDVPKSVLHYWLRPHPLKGSERRAIRSSAVRAAQPRKSLPGGDGTPCVLAEDLSTIARGAVAENFVKYDASRFGLQIMKSDSDGDVVDIYVRLRGGHKVAFLQVRMTSSPPARNGLPTISLRRYRNGRANRFEKGDFHFLVGFCPENSRTYIYSSTEVSHLVNSVTISEDGCGAWHKVIDFLTCGQQHGDDAVGVAGRPSRTRAAPRKKRVAIAAPAERR